MRWNLRIWLIGKTIFGRWESILIYFGISILFREMRKRTKFWCEKMENSHGFQGLFRFINREVWFSHSDRVICHISLHGQSYIHGCDDAVNRNTSDKLPNQERFYFFASNFGIKETNSKARINLSKIFDNNSHPRHPGPGIFVFSSLWESLQN